MVTTQAADVQAEFEYWQGLPGTWVEAPNEARGGSSGVQRVRLPDGRLAYRKQQIDYCYRDLRHPLGEPTVRREARTIRVFSALGVQVPELVYCGTRRVDGQWHALLLTAELEGFRSMEAWELEGDLAGWPDALRASVFGHIGSMLARVHRARWQHGCLYPKHIFLRLDADGAIQVALLDLEKCRKRFSGLRAARADLRQLKRRAAWGAAEWDSLEAGYTRAGGPPLGPLLG